MNPAMANVGSDPRGTGESTLNNGLTALLNEFNGNIESSNVKDASLTINDLGTGANGLAVGSFSAYRAAAVSLGSASVVPFETEEWDVSGWFDVTTNVGRFTPLVAGIYRFSWRVASGGTLAADQYWGADLYKNAALHKAGQYAPMRATIGPSSTGSFAAQANGTSDFFDIRVSHNKGAAEAIVVGAAVANFQGELVGRS